jgi:hypothetical protein
MNPWLHPDTVLLGADCPLPLTEPFTGRRAAALGVSSGQLRHLLERRLVRRVVRGVYAVAQAPDDPGFRAIALHLVLPDGAVVTDRTAAWLQGVDILPRSARTQVPPVQVFHPPGNRARRAGVASGERLLLPSDVVQVDGISVTSPLRTALDLARLLWRFDALAALDQFLRLGVSLEELLFELSRFKGYRGIIQARCLVPLADPRAESVAESALRLHWYDAGLPTPELQWWVYDDAGVPIYRLDLALPEARFAAEYDGVDFHSGGADRAHDEQRRAWLRDRRRWVVEVFQNDDVYRLHADPARRLVGGLLRAREGLGDGTTYIFVRGL